MLLDLRTILYCATLNYCTTLNYCATLIYCTALIYCATLICYTVIDYDKIYNKTLKITNVTVISSWLIVCKFPRQRTVSLVTSQQKKY